MKKFFQILLVLLLNAGISFGLLRYFVLSKQVVIEAGSVVEQTIIAEKKTVVIGTGASFSGNIVLQEGNVIVHDGANIFGDISLQEGKIILGKQVQLQGNLVGPQIEIDEGSVVNGNIDMQAQLKKHADAKVSGKMPSLFITSNYPDYLQYFDALPIEHKKNLGYIYLTSSNMAIRNAKDEHGEVHNDLPLRTYYKAIFYYDPEHDRLATLDLQDEELLQQHYANTKKYVNKISDSRARRYDVAFTTLPHAFDRKRSDVYLSSHSANAELFVHEFGHVQDFAYNYIDYHVPVYPYTDKEHAITEYGKFHKGEDFAEGYRYYVLHNQALQTMAKQDKEIQQKYDYFKTVVFKGLEYMS